MVSEICVAAESSINGMGTGQCDYSLLPNNNIKLCVSRTPQIEIEISSWDRDKSISACMGWSRWKIESDFQNSRTPPPDSATERVLATRLVVCVLWSGGRIFVNKFQLTQMQRLLIDFIAFRNCVQLSSSCVARERLCPEIEISKPIRVQNQNQNQKDIWFLTGTLPGQDQDRAGGCPHMCGAGGMGLVFTQEDCL